MRLVLSSHSSFFCLCLHALIVQGKKPSTNIKKLFQFVHEMVTALGSQNPAHGEISLQLFLHGAQLADYFGFKSIAYEFMTKVSRWLVASDRWIYPIVVSYSH